MQTIRVLEKTGKDGMLSLRIPLGKPEAEYEVLVVVQPRTVAPTPQEGGWPPGYLEKTAGSIDDETFERAPQGEMPKPVDFDEGLQAPNPDPWAAVDAIRNALAATGRDFGDSVQDIREDRDR